ncbi:hypothetical protein CDES_13070 [Corynebacterium deserti GIMN1.010]|uniref:Gram-positive cocci surface proteins LPxTG domain-containing protein n=1 Tax=Corynebacterium deserti GIMN1.010 TaxID=931089 RepID=A0A0M4CKB8_9CORY|nr:choice-of-anchor G family protein [Corynebacterium deserti]ALC06958.1 hypothetical protein CDES_13070 [Corynebacterium deserti GIMN1.010]
MKTKLSRIIATVLSVFLIAGVIVPTPAKAQPTSPYDSLQEHLEDAYSYGYGGLLDLRLLNGYLTIDDPPRALSVAELNGVNQLWKVLQDDGQTANTSAIDLNALGLIYVNLGAISLPLIGDNGLLQFVLPGAGVGALHEFAHAPSANNAEGIVGVVSDTGGLELTQPGAGANAHLDLVDLLTLGGNDTGILSGIIQEASLSLGAISAAAQKPDQQGVYPPADLCRTGYTRLDYADLSQAGDPATFAEEDGRICSVYQIADAKLTIKSEQVGALGVSLSNTLKSALATTEDGVELLLGGNGLLTRIRDLPLLGPLLQSVVNGAVEITTEIRIDEEGLVKPILEEKLADSTGLVSIDLATGEIIIDIEKLHAGGLNGLDPNTNLISAGQLTQITQTVTNLLTASPSVEPNGLIAKLDRIVRGENQQGGLYATEVYLDICVLRALGVCTADPKITATLGGLLTGAQPTTNLSTYQNNPYDYYYRDGLLGILLSGLIVNLLTAVGTVVNDLLFDDPTYGLGSIVGSLQSSLITPVFDLLDPALQLILKPIANIIVNRQTLTEVEHGTVFTVSALEVNVLDFGTPTSDVLHLPLATASVMAQHWKPIEVELNVAKMGDGRNLHLGDYTYDLVCTTTDGLVVFEEDQITYAAGNVGERFDFTDNPNQLTLVNGTGLTRTAPMPADTKCVITANPTLADEKHVALRPTGDTLSRTPYTYFLDTDDLGLFVSNEESTWTSINDLSDIDTGSVGDIWKRHKFEYVVPAGAEKLPINIVHNYDLDKRNVVVTKDARAIDPAGKGNFKFQYSIDGGTTWSATQEIPHGGSFTIADVPFLDSTSREETQIQVREEIPAPAESVPTVTWLMGDPGTDWTGSHNGTHAVADAFAANTGITVDMTTTPDIQLKAVNTYNESVTVDFEATLPQTGRTTLVWVIGLGLLAALGALIMYVRSRNK